MSRCLAARKTSSVKSYQIRNCGGSREERHKTTPIEPTMHQSQSIHDLRGQGARMRLRLLCDWFPRWASWGKEAFLPTQWTPFNKGLPARLPVQRWMGLPSPRDGQRPQNFSICSCFLNKHCQSAWSCLWILRIPDFSTQLHCFPVSSPKHVPSLVMETALPPPLLNTQAQELRNATGPAFTKENASASLHPFSLGRLHSVSFVPIAI